MRNLLFMIAGPVASWGIAATVSNNKVLPTISCGSCSVIHDESSRSIIHDERDLILGVVLTICVGMHWGDGGLRRKDGRDAWITKQNPATGPVLASFKRFEVACCVFSHVKDKVCRLSRKEKRVVFGLLALSTIIQQNSVGILVSARVGTCPSTLPITVLYGVYLARRHDKTTQAVVTSSSSIVMRCAARCCSNSMRWPCRKNDVQ